jgi:hypothetical protein
MMGMYILRKKVLIRVYKLGKEARGMVLHTGIAFYTAFYHGMRFGYTYYRWHEPGQYDRQVSNRITLF